MGKGAGRPGEVDERVRLRKHGRDIGCYDDPGRRARELAGILAEQRVAGLLERAR